MPKKQRLSGSSIRRLKPEKRLNSELFSLIVARTPQKSALACTVSKKVATRAVERNRIKRRTRAIMQRLLPFPPDTSYILIAKKAAAKATFEELAHDISSLMERAQVASSR